MRQIGYISLCFILLWQIGPLLAGLFEITRLAYGASALTGAGGLKAWIGFDMLMAQAGLWQSLGLSLFTALTSAVISLFLALVILFYLGGNPYQKRIFWYQKWLLPLVAIPHLTISLGLAFLLIPAGLFSRMAYPLYSLFWQGADGPPQFSLIQDEAGLSLILALVIKETAFLTLMGLTALRAMAGQNLYMQLGYSLGYKPWQSYWLVTAPLLYKRLKLAVMIVIGYALSVVDVALILAPTTPPPFALWVQEWASKANPQFWLQAGAGALVLIMLMGAALVIWRGGEFLIKALFHAKARRGLRYNLASGPLKIGALAVIYIGLFLTLFAGLSLLLWAFGRSWWFPDLWPNRWGFDALKGLWTGGQLGAALWGSLWVGLVASTISLALAVLWLEIASWPAFRHFQKSEALFYLALILPQLSFLTGFLAVAKFMAPNAYAGLVIWGHCLMVFPIAYWW